MKKINRRSFLTAMGAASAAGLMSACGAKSSSSVAASSSVAGTASSEVAAEPVTIHFGYWYAENDEPTMEKFAKCVAEFNETEPNIEVILDAQATASADDYAEKYSMLLLAGDKTDIIATKSMDLYALNAGRGLYANIEPYMQAAGHSTDDYTISTKLEDGVFGLPLNSTANIVLINKNALEEAGLPWPSDDWTWDDYAEMARKMTKEVDGKTRYGSIMPYWGDPVMYYLGLAQNCDDNPLFKSMTEHNLDDPNLKAFLEYRYNLAEEGADVSYVDYTTNSLSYGNEFLVGNAAMVVTGTFTFAAIADIETYPHDFVTGVMHTPSFNGSAPGKERDSAGVASVNKNIDDAHKEAAYKFLRYYTTKGQVQMGNLPTAREFDVEPLVENILGAKPELVDEESLRHWMTNPIRKACVATFTPPQEPEIKAIVKEEGDKYMSGGQTIDEAIAAMCKRADAVMAQ